VAHVCQWDRDTSKWEGSQEALTWCAWQGFLCTHPWGKVVQFGCLEMWSRVPCVPYTLQGTGRSGRQYPPPSCLVCAVCIVRAPPARSGVALSEDRKEGS